MSINIVLIGAGEVGFNLAKVLSKENYDLTVVDIDKKKCNRVQNTIDARVIEGNGCSQRILLSHRTERQGNANVWNVGITGFDSHGNES